jgi:hypothetical protein
MLYTLTVVARDNGNPPQQTAEVLKVRVVMKKIDV